MKSPVRTKNRVVLPGVIGTARVERRTHVLLPRLRPGDIAVIDHLDMDRATAQALVDAGVAAVVNVSPMISGRYPNLGPEVLTGAGVPVLDRVEGTDAIEDGSTVRVHDEVVYLGETPIAMGREVDGRVIEEEMADARLGLVTQLETFTHNSAEFLRREQDLLLHGLGLPKTATRIEGRPVVVVVPGHEHRAELSSIKAFLREQNPVLIGVDRGADVLLEAGFRPDIVVLADAVEDSDRPSAKALRGARDVLLRVDRGARGHTDQLERIGVRAVHVETAATTEDVALLLADAAHASVIVGVGMHATLDEFLDRQRSGLASTYLTRLKVGHLLVDARALPTVYAGRVRPRHLLLVLLAGLIALGAAIATTPVGQEWAEPLTRLVTDLTDDLQGLFS